MNDISPGPFGPTPSTAAGGSSLDHLSLLAVRGTDARTFLDSQLTRNVPQPSAPASPAGYCSPKGRLLATFVMWAEAGTIWMIVSRDLAAAIAKRLRMYVMRAKVTIDEVDPSLRLDGFVSGERLPPLPDLAIWHTQRIDDRAWLRFPDADGKPRYLRVAPHDAAADHAVDAQRWRWFDVRAGLPRITTATQDRFVPQMLNLEALGGVDFKKGCFPGQEVVARSQYLGKLKRRMALATCDAPAPSPGTDVWDAEGREACGLVVDAEAGPDGRVSLLVELPVASFASSTLRIGSPEGSSLTVEPLPYELPDNEVFVRPKL